MSLHFFRWDQRHLEEITAIEKASFTLPWSRESFMEVISSGVFDSFAAMDAQKSIVGYVVFCEVLEELQVLNIAIHPDHRQKGYGRLMLSHVHKHAYARGRRESFLEVRESNEAAIALYKEFGYQSYTRRPKYYSDTNEDALLMKAILRP